MNKQVICIVCPKGCKVFVNEENGIYTTTGNACNRGNIYGIQEAIEPKRMLTSTVKINGALHQRCPVVSSGPIKKDLIMEALKVLETISLSAPVTIEQIICHNICDSGVDILVSRTMGKTNDL